MSEDFTTIKLIILFLLKNANGELTNSQIAECILDREYTNYFFLQQSLCELVDAGLTTMTKRNKTSFYEITEDGCLALSFYEQDLEKTTRTEILEYLNQVGYKRPEQISYPAEFYVTPSGKTAVRCRIIEEDCTLIDLTLCVPGTAAANAVCETWPEKGQQLLEHLLEELI